MMKLCHEAFEREKERAPGNLLLSVSRRESKKDCLELFQMALHLVKEEGSGGFVTNIKTKKIELGLIELWCNVLSRFLNIL